MAKLSSSSDTQAVPLVSIRTPFNRREPKSTLETRRVLLKGRWVRPDPAASRVLAWMRS
jgi:hypothetical protein